MKSLAISYVVFLVIFAGVDFVWLSRAGDALYRPTMGDMTLADFRLAPAVAFYLIYAVGAIFFAVAPALETGDWMTAALRGALFGLCAYATYDLTNHATLKNWSTTLSLVDMGWGSLLTAFASACACKITSALAS
jgi:uncharacterized membrane protein